MTREEIVAYTVVAVIAFAAGFLSGLLVWVTAPKRRGKTDWGYLQEPPPPDGPPPNQSPPAPCWPGSIFGTMCFHASGIEYKPKGRCGE